MNYRKFLLIFLLIGISMCMLLGCSNQSAADDSRNTKSEQDVTTVLDNIPETFQQKDGNVVFDAEVKLNDYDKEKGLVTASAHLQKVNVEKALALLWQERDGKYIEEGYESENEYGEKVITMSGSNADKYSLTDELDFMTREDAFSKLESDLKQM